MPKDTFTIHRYCLCILLAWAPIPLGSNREWSKCFLVFAISLLGIAWCIAHIRHRPGFSNSLESAKLAVLTLALIPIFTLIQVVFATSVSPSISFSSLHLSVAYLFVFIMILDCFRTKESLKIILITLVASGTIQAFYGASMVLTGLEYSFFEEKSYMKGLATGTFVNRNHLAGYLEMTLACGIGLLIGLRSNKKITLNHVSAWLLSEKAVVRIAVVIMVIALVMTRSRMGNVSFISSLLLCSLVLAAFSREYKLRFLLLIASFIVVDSLILAQYFGLDQLHARITATQINDVYQAGELVARQNEVRDEVFIYAKSLISEFWLTGSGAGTFEIVFQSVAGPDIYNHFDHAHNDYLQLLIEYGLPGFILFLFFSILCFRQALLAVIKPASTFRQGIGFVSLMSITSLALHSVTDFNLQIPANALTLVALFSLSYLARPAVRSASCSSEHANIVGYNPKSTL